MTTSWDGNTADAGATLAIYNIDSLQKFVTEVNTEYFSISSDDNFDRMVLDTDADGTAAPIQMVIRKIDKNKPSDLT